MEEIITSKLAEFGVLGMVVLFFIREFFTYLKAKKGNGNAGNINKDIIAELQKISSNDLEHIKDCITDNNNSLKESIHADTKTMIEILGRIEGLLRSR